MIFVRTRAIILLALSGLFFYAWPKLLDFVVSQGFEIQVLGVNVTANTFFIIGVASNLLAASVVLAAWIAKELEKRNRLSASYSWLYSNICITLAYGWLLFFFFTGVYGPCYCSFSEMGI